MRIPPRQNIQCTLNQCFVSPHQLNGRSVQCETSSVLFLMVHDGHDFAANLHQTRLGLISIDWPESSLSSVLTLAAGNFLAVQFFESPTIRGDLAERHLTYKLLQLPESLFEGA